MTAHPQDTLPPGPDGATATAGDALPGLVITADPRHGVTRYAAQLAEALGGPITDARGDTGRAGHPERLHLHFTDRLWGADPAAAAAAVEELAGRAALTVTLHDVPQPSDGAESLRRRASAYRRVVDAATGIVVNSRHELTLLRRHTAPDARATVIPLPVDVAPPAPGAAPEAEATVGVLGFVYPGKGHDRVIRAVGRLAREAIADGEATPGGVGVGVLGRASDGHERDLESLAELARREGVPFSVSGYLPDAELLARSRRTGVPVIAHEHVSASGSLASWLGAGRHPVVVRSPYMEEMAELHGGCLTLTDAEHLSEAVAAALDDPASTWLDPAALDRLGPDTARVAHLYRTFWQEVEW